MKFKNSTPSEVEVNMTPMIDIVFQLIAFFMVVINFEQTQADERVKLPRDELAQPPKTARESERVFNIGYVRDKKGNIEKGGPYIWLPGVERTDISNKKDPRYPNGFQWPNDREAFNKMVGKIKRSLERDEKFEVTTIILRADLESAGGITTDIINELQQQGFTKFAFSATQAGDDKKKKR